MYYAERHENPEAFGSILRVMSWAISTPFTAGFGGATPTSLLGQLLGSLVALWYGVFKVLWNHCFCILETRRTHLKLLSTDEFKEVPDDMKRTEPLLALNRIHIDLFV